MRLFLDCDDCLILWLDRFGKVEDSGPNPYGGGNVDHVVNTDLVKAVEYFLIDVRPWEVVVWSGGGDWYALKWLREIWPEKEGEYYAISKDPRIPVAGDICVDDATLKLAEDVKLMTPQDFIDMVML